MYQAIWLDAEHGHQGHAIEEVLSISSDDAARSAGGLLLDCIVLVCSGLSVSDLWWHEVLLNEL